MDDAADFSLVPAWRPRDHAAPSVFRPEHLLREARRQRGLPERDVPAVCVLDPDGDLVRHLRRTGRARPSPGWACYHTELLEFALADGTAAGVVGCAVGAPFAVLVAEQLFASGCRFLVSVTSAGRIAELGEPPYAVLIDRALRDEGTSAHYLPPGAGEFVAAPDPALLARVEAAVRAVFSPGCGTTYSTAVHRGATWTTDAPYRETEAAIAAARARGVLAVEMEAAALYAFAAARGVQVACFAHVTNTMGQHGGDDFEKGEANGAVTALRLIEAATRAFRGTEASR
jgi:uridine phosphorylase